MWECHIARICAHRFVRIRSIMNFYGTLYHKGILKVPCLCCWKNTAKRQKPFRCDCGCAKQQSTCHSGGMADTRDLKSLAEKRVSSSLICSINMRECWNRQTGQSQKLLQKCVSVRSRLSARKN